MSLIKLGRGDILHKILIISNFFFFLLQFCKFFWEQIYISWKWIDSWGDALWTRISWRLEKTQKRKIPKKSPLPIAVIFSPSFGVPGRVEAKLQTGYPNQIPLPNPLKEEEATGFMVRYTENQSVKAPKPTSSSGAFWREMGFNPLSSKKSFSKRVCPRSNIPSSMC